MGFYTQQIVPRVIDKACARKPALELRQRVCAGLAGDVVEIGFGTGLNVAYYPAAVSRVSAVEPSDIAWKIAGKRIGASAIPIDRSGLDGQSLPFADNSFDAALSTWTMCTIPDLAAALAELRRVLKPGGSVHFVEHGLAPDAGVARWQHRLDPLQGRLFAGCSFSRQIVDQIGTAGFTVGDVDVFYERGAPRFAGAISLGTAQRN